MMLIANHFIFLSDKPFPINNFFLLKTCSKINRKFCLRINSDCGGIGIKTSRLFLSRDILVINHNDFIPSQLYSNMSQMHRASNSTYSPTPFIGRTNP